MRKVFRYYGKYFPAKIDLNLNKTSTKDDQVPTKSKLEYTKDKKTETQKIVYKKAEMQEFNGLPKLINNGSLNYDETMSNIYMKQRYYGKVLQYSKNNLQRIKAYTRLGYPERAFDNLKTLQEWTTVLAGFARNGKIMEMELIFDIMKSRFTLHTAAYNTLMNGYSNVSNFNKVLEIYQTIARNKLKPDFYTYSIIDSCSMKSGDERFTKIIGDLSELDNDIARFNRILYKVREETLDFDGLIRIFENNPRIIHTPGLFAGVLNELVVQDSPNISSFIRYALDRKVPMDASMFASLIKLCEGDNPRNAFKVFEKLKAHNVPPNRGVYQNLLELAYRTNHLPTLQRINREIRQQLWPKGFYKWLINLYCQQRPTCINYYTRSKLQLLNLEIPTAESLEDEEEFLNIRSNRNIDSFQHHYTRMAFAFICEMWNRAEAPKPSLLRMVIRNALIPLDDKTLKQVRSIQSFIEKVRIGNENQKANEKIAKQYHEIFWQTLFECSRWDIIFMVKDEEPYFKVLLHNEIDKRTNNQEYLWLYTAGRKFYLESDSLAKVIDGLGTVCKSEDYVTTLFESVPPSRRTEEVIWAYIKALLWLGNHEKAVDIANTEYRVEYSGNAIKELKMWLKSNNLKVLESKLCAHWEPIQPSWTNTS